MLLRPLALYRNKGLVDKMPIGAALTCNIDCCYQLNLRPSGLESRALLSVPHCLESSTLTTEPHCLPLNATVSPDQRNHVSDFALTMRVHVIPFKELMPISSYPNSRRVKFGCYEMEAWYSSPFPEEFWRLKKIYICEFCLKYMKSATVLRRHMVRKRWGVGKCPETTITVITTITSSAIVITVVIVTTTSAIIIVIINVAVTAYSPFTMGPCSIAGAKYLPYLA